VLVALVAGCGGDGGGTTTSAEPTTTKPPATTQPPATTDPPATTEPPATTSGPPAAACSAAGLSAKLTPQDLPEPVAELRERIAEAAVACDYGGLAAIAAENPEGFSFTFGSATSAAAYWRRLETQGADEPMARLVQILELPVTRNELGAYAWPSAYTENPTEADWQALAGIYPPEQLELMRGAGSYLGYRTAISADGRWLFFVAGD